VRNRSYDANNVHSKSVSYATHVSGIGRSWLGAAVDHFDLFGLCQASGLRAKCGSHEVHSGMLKVLTPLP
jgi:hypothetical protein